MSWFDASGLSSFAKTALSQAQNLQKSIDRVLDIEDETGGTASKSSASSKPKSTSSSSSNAKESLTTRKSSSSSSATTTSKSSGKTLSDLNNSKESDSEGNSFWSSFLGDSFSSTTTNTESKTSSRRTSGRKLGSRSNSTTTVNEGNVGGGDDKNELESVNTSSNSSGRTLKQHTKRNINQTNTAKSDGNLQASHALLSHQEGAANGSKDLSNQDENVTDFVNSQVVEDTSPEKAEFNTQELIVAPGESEKKLKSERLKLSSTGKTRRGNKEVFTPGNDVSRDQNDASLQDVSPVKNSEVSKEIKANASHEEPASPSQSHNTETDVYSTPKWKPVESHETNENANTTQNTDIISSQDVGEGLSNVVSKSVNSDLNGSSLVDSTDNVVITDKTGQEIQTGSEQNKFLDVEPLASSTPNHHVKERSASLDKVKKLELTPSQPVDEYTEVLNQKENALVYAVQESESPITDAKEDKTVSEDVAEMFKEATSFIEEKESTGSRKQEIEACTDSEVDKLPLQQSDTSSETAATIPEETAEETTEEKENNLMENDANSTHSSEDLRRKIEELQNEVANFKHVIEVRENKLVEVSKENVDLQETSAILRSQLKQAETALKAEDEEIEEVRQEFTVRVATTEKKLQAAARERDQLRVLLEETEKSLGSRNDRQSEEYTTLLKEKDDQIAQLLDEGEKLSKQQLQSNNIVKKLRNKEKENDALIKKNSKSLEDMTSENTRLAEILQVKEETERKQADGITQLNAYVEKQEVQISKLKSELDDSAEKIRSMQAALDSAYKQLTDLHKENASKDSAVQEAALSAEMTAKEGLRIAMEKKQRQFKNENEVLEFQISDLQTALRRGEQQASRREDNLRQEISDVQQRLQEAEARNQELTESVTYASRPLLRQIENLQSSYGNHTQTWERVERNLTERLSEAQIQLVEAQEKERVATEHALELNSRVTAVESQLATYRQDKSRLEATLEVERTRLETAEEARSREAARIETIDIKYRKMMEDNNVEKALLEQQLAVERGKMETEKKKFQHAMDEKERILLRQSSLSGAPSSPSAREEFSQDVFPEASPHRTLARQSSSNSVIDGMSRGLMGAGTAMIERLQAQVKQKDGEIGLLQEEITSLQKTRDAVTEELTSLTSKLESVEEDSRLLADLQTRHKELEQRHNAVLQMYGEKAEQAEELRMDLEDVKSMYKSQIQELLGASR